MKLEFYQPLGHPVANAHVQDALLSQYRGFTALPGQGAWRREDGSIEREPVEVLTVFTNGKYIDNFVFLQHLALQYLVEAQQEAVLFTIDSNPQLVHAKHEHVALAA